MEDESKKMWTLLYKGLCRGFQGFIVSTPRVPLSFRDNIGFRV